MNRNIRIRKILYKVLTENDEIVFNRDSFQDVLESEIKDDPLQINLLLTAADAGFFLKIRNASEITENLCDTLAEKLIYEYGIADQHARWCAELCCSVYGTEIKNIETTMHCQNDFGGGSKDKMQSPSEDLQANLQKLSGLGTLDNLKKNMIKNPRKRKGTDLKELKDNEKLDRTIAEYSLDENAAYGVRNLTFTLRNRRYLSGDCDLKVTGEADLSMVRETLILYIMLYNEENEMISADFYHRMHPGEKMHVFSRCVRVPRGEKIARVRIRTGPDPVNE